MKLTEDISFIYHTQEYFEFSHYTCTGMKGRYGERGATLILGVNDYKSQCVCMGCGKRWDVPYSNLVMAAKMKTWEKDPPSNRKVKIKQYYHTVQFTGLDVAEGGEDAFAASMTDAISKALKGN